MSAASSTPTGPPQTFTDPDIQWDETQWDDATFDDALMDGAMYDVQYGTAGHG